MNTRVRVGAGWSIYQVFIDHFLCGEHCAGDTWVSQSLPSQDWSSGRGDQNWCRTHARQFIKTNWDKLGSKGTRIHEPINQQVWFFFFQWGLRNLIWESNPMMISKTSRINEVEVWAIPKVERRQHVQRPSGELEHGLCGAEADDCGWSIGNVI